MDDVPIKQFDFLDVSAFFYYPFLVIMLMFSSTLDRSISVRTGEHVSLCSGFAASTAPARKCIFSPDGTELLKISQDEPHRASVRAGWG